MPTHILDMKQQRITVTALAKMKLAGEKVGMLTAYDHTMAKLLDRAGVEILLVGDSASNVVGGNDTTLPITLDQMIYHGKAVVSAAKRSMVVVDMPFGSYQVSPEQAVQSAIRIMKETGAHAVKLEGGLEMVETVRRITTIGIPVMGHVGLTPQSVHQFGGFGLRAKEKTEADKLLEACLGLESAGCFGAVLEKIPASLAQEATARLKMITIGIGAGPDCDGQVLVVNDLLGLDPEFKPRFVRHYATLSETVNQAVFAYLQDVKSGGFPSKEESF